MMRWDVYCRPNRTAAVLIRDERTGATVRRLVFTAWEDAEFAGLRAGASVFIWHPDAGYEVC